MATWGYNVYLIRLNTSHRTRVLHRLSAFGESKDQDLLQGACTAAASILGAWRPLKKSTEGFRVREVDVRGRIAFIKANRGIHGVQGEAYKIDTGESVDHDEKTALLSGLRCMLAIPEDAYYGLLFVERVAGRHLKEIVKEFLFVPAIAMHDVVIHVDPFAQDKDWDLLLAGKEALEIREYLEVRDSGEDASTPPSAIKVIVDGPRVASLTQTLREAVIGRSARYLEHLDLLARSAELQELKALGSGGGFTVQRADELKETEDLIKEYRRSQAGLAKETQDQLDDVVPVQVEAGQTVVKQRYDVAVGADRPERVFSLERETLPTFTFELGSHLTDAGLREFWVAHAEEILTARGIHLPVGWAQ